MHKDFKTDKTVFYAVFFKEKHQIFSFSIRLMDYEKGKKNAALT